MDTNTLLNLLDELQNQDAEQRDKNLDKDVRMRSISRDTAETISVLFRIGQPKTIIEIGTSHGYSTIWLGLVAKSLGGKVISYEILETKAKIARENINKAGLSDYVEIKLGNILTNPEILPSKIDAVFLDAEKVDYVPHFKTFYPKLRNGGFVIADNIVSHFAELRDYVNFVRTNENLSSTTLTSVGKGIEVTYKFSSDDEKKVPWNELIR